MENVIAESNAPDSTARRFLSKIDLRGWLGRMPLPIQALVTFFFVQLFIVNLAVPDLIPLIDEVVCGWLLYMGISASAATVRERYGHKLSSFGKRRQVIDIPQERDVLPDLEEAEAHELDPVLVHATLKEMEGLDPEILREAIAEIEGV